MDNDTTKIGSAMKEIDESLTLAQKTEILNGMSAYMERVTAILKKLKSLEKKN